jgi:hypothetical protein
MVRLHMDRRQAAPSLDARPVTRPITYAMAQLPLLLAELAELGHPIRRAFATWGRSRS